MNLFRAFVTFDCHAAVECALVALGFAAAQVRFADVRPHQFAGRGNLEAFCGCFVSFQFRHETNSIFDF